MPPFIQPFLDAFVRIQANPGALVAAVALGAFALIGLALYVVLQSLKKGE